MLNFAQTELGAVNAILSSIGEAPVNSLDNLTNIDAINALNTLQNENKTFQMRSWWFNKHTNFTLHPDKQINKIHWINNILYIKGTNGGTIVKKGQYLYDIKTQTDTYLNPIQVEIVFLLPFEDLPEAAKSFVTAQSALTFQTRYFGDATQTQILEREAQRAYIAFCETDMDANDYNMLDNPSVTGLKAR